MKTLDVEFQGMINRAANCICDACHAVSQAVMLKLPTTKYFDGNGLSTRYENYWLCAKCRARLVKALDWPDEGGLICQR